MEQDVDYNPKHMKQYTSSMSHCCFAGCTPMGCPGRCCVQEMGHRADCPSNPFRELDEYEHECYVNAGMRKHLASEDTPRIVGVQRICPKCGEPVHISRRVCFGSDPHSQYRCTNCQWRGRTPDFCLGHRDG